MQNSPCADADKIKRVKIMRTREEFAIIVAWGVRWGSNKRLEAFDIHILELERGL